MKQDNDESMTNILILSWLWVGFTIGVFAYGWKFIERRGVIETNYQSMV